LLCSHSRRRSRLLTQCATHRIYNISDEELYSNNNTYNIIKVPNASCIRFVCIYLRFAPSRSEFPDEKNNNNKRFFSCHRRANSRGRKYDLRILAKTTIVHTADESKILQSWKMSVFADAAVMWTTGDERIYVNFTEALFTRQHLFYHFEKSSDPSHFKQYWHVLLVTDSLR